jgi:hypothetical protein
MGEAADEGLRGIPERAYSGRLAVIGTET